ncbi:MAG: CDP-diacylglycerol--serine O-phosphatidyltransferase [Cellvibrionaceae bacterium]|jgi:CDP-diacylglycerol--serine O-phosphatidyltransferase
MSGRIKPVPNKDKAGDSNESLTDKSANASPECYIPIDEHIEEVSENGEKVRHRGVYLLPNLFTTGALFSGFYAIIISMSGNFEAAAIAIFVSQILDGLDGRVARLTNTSSEFGVQYDSLADMVSFGVAPAIVVLNWGLEPLGKFAWAAVFAYTACAALRLARFNTQTGFTDNRFFIGLASPAAAGVVASVVWVFHDQQIPNYFAVIVAVAMVFLAILMVSNFKYSSFKGVDLKGRVPFVKMLLVISLFVVIASNPPVMLLTLTLIYAVSGPLLWLWRIARA